ncbi:MAG: M20 family metallopeptidase [Defluviitaleaceae bacterium]|nr:M20 family metallopeptidase [Defluviitaleaceae bacterium]
MLTTELKSIHEEMIEMRRHLHMNPELSFQEVKTPAYIVAFLKQHGIEVREKVGGRGVVGTIKGDQPGKTVALRADFDALAMDDEKDVPYQSKVKGVNHACGHDGHTATLLGVAKVLSQHTHLIKGEVRLIFQFAEEVPPGGAIDMIADDCLLGVDAIFGTHLSSRLPVGAFNYTIGPMMASADKFTIELFGRGGHGAAPHQTVDPIVLSAQLITMMQTVISRRINPISQGVLTFGSVHAGSAFNVIPDKAMLIGTVRTFDKEVQQLITEEMEKIIKGLCDAAGATYTFEYTKGYPALVNHEQATKLLIKSLEKIVPKEKIIEMDPMMGGEDFAYYLEQVPGTFFNTGARNDEKGITYPHHHPKFDIDEDSLLYAAQALVTVALDYLNQ